MEIQFRRTVCPCLHKVTHQVQTQEQTQEVRLPDGMPDIGRVLGCWGQTVIRSKEWRGAGMSVSGGVMAWVLYAPEDGEEPASVECWIPFQMKWDFPQTQRDGAITVWPSLRSVDARSTSARKLMVRACVSVMGDAMEPVEEEIYMAEGLPEDIQLLTQVYPVELPVEAGEKLFDLEEDVPWPEQMPKPDKLLRYEWTPEIQEQKVISGRLVLRGAGSLHLMYRAEDGSFQSMDCQLPFSQYTQLDRDHSASAQCQLIPLVTALDVEMTPEKQLRMKCSMSAQYILYDRVMVEITEDAYSPDRAVELQLQELRLPMRLDVCSQDMDLSAELECQAQRVVDVCRTGEIPVSRTVGDVTQIGIDSQFQVLYADENGLLQSQTVRAEGESQLCADKDARTEVTAFFGPPQAVLTGSGIAVHAPCRLDTAVFTEQGLPMVTDLKVGQPILPDPQRPSLILRPMTQGRLWDIAKSCNTTVDAIQKANRLTQEPEMGQMLLIPVP